MYTWLACTCIMVNILTSNAKYNKHMSIEINKKCNSLFSTQVKFCYIVILY